ncbi:MAG: transcriptional repressor [Proteobacteria bacterium]|nr:MAG: transcriptional repressor [Pseudomonadota bacterium]
MPTEKLKQKQEWFWERLDQYLAKSQLKHSKQRNFIIEEFLSMKTHVSAEELYSQLKASEHNPGLATVYRTLNLLKDAGLVDQKQFSDGKSVFEVMEPGTHHDHLICLTCHKVIEFENEEIERLQEQVAKKLGFKLTKHSLELFGTCAECVKKL